jgi:hypothetical protein
MDTSLGMDQEIEEIFDAIKEFVKQQHMFPKNVYDIYFYFTLRSSHQVNHTYFKRIGDTILEKIEKLESHEAKTFIELFLRRSQMAEKYNILYIHPQYLMDIFQSVQLKIHFHNKEYIIDFCKKIGASKGLEYILVALHRELYKDLMTINKELEKELYEYVWRPERIVKMLDTGMSIDDVFDIML